MRPSPLQIHYQRNMLLGLCASLLISCAFSGWVWSLDPHESKAKAPAVLEVRPSADTTHSAEEGIGPIFAGFNPYAREHHGFMGFASIRLQASAPQPAVVRVPSFSDTPDMPSDDTPTISYSPIAGDETGTYIPDGIGFSGGGGKPQPTTPLNRDILVVQKVDPEYPRIARQAGKEGQIVVLVYLDSLGRLTQFPSWVTGEGKMTLQYSLGPGKMYADYAYSEDPPDWFFAHNFLKVLPHWRFAPRIENGRPVGALLRIRYTFCLSSDCKKFSLQTVSRVDP